MYPIYRHSYNTVQSGLERTAKLNIIVTIARNVINFSISGCDLISKIHRFKPIAIPLKAYLKIIKDISTRFVFAVTVAEILTPAFWDTTKTSFAKKGNRFCKLVYSGLDTFWLIPNKWKQITSPISALLCKDMFVIASAGFGVWHASEEINEAHRKIKKNEERLNNHTLTKIIDSKPNVLSRISQEIDALKETIALLNAEIKGLKVTPEQVRKIYKISLIIEKNKQELCQKEEKRRRILSSPNENIEQINDFRIRKACTKIDLYKRQITKNHLIQGIEITKIALVALQCLLTSGFVAASSPTIGTGILICSSAIGSISLALTIYDIFFWKNPKHIMYPTTSLLVT